MPENSPEYGNIAITKEKLPYRSEPYLKAEFSDPQLAGFVAILVQDTADLEDGRLATLITRFPRKVLAEINTHRVFARNSASSRARSVRSVIQSVLDDPFVPRFTRNMKGMSGKFVSEDEQRAAEKVWLRGRDRAIETQLELLLGSKYDPSLSIHDLLDVYYEAYNSGNTEGMLSVHKQDANRVLEPYMWHEAIITSSEWKNFFELRTDLSAADPSIYAIAVLMEAVLKESTPVDSQIHLPFIPDNKIPSPSTPIDEVRPILMRSATEAAQVSYKDKATATKSTASSALGERLLSMRHMSPFEHVAYRRDAPAVRSFGPEASRNFNQNWVQLRGIYD